MHKLQHILRCLLFSLIFLVWHGLHAVCMADDLRSDARPNIIFILADDVGQEVLGCYGGESYATPNLDHLAKTGMRFRHCYAMPMCHPTRVTLLTGKYPFRLTESDTHIAPRWGTFPAQAESQTFAHKLAQARYATGVFGKWQLALLRDTPDHAYRLGFQESQLFGWHEGPRYHEPLIYHNGKLRSDTLGHYGPDLYVHALVEFVKANRERPFLAFYPMALCHDVTDDLEVPVPHGPLERYESYPEMVAEMDRAVGRIISALNSLKLVKERSSYSLVTTVLTPDDSSRRGQPTGASPRGIKTKWSRCAWR